MTKDEAVRLIKLIVVAKIDLEHDMIREAKGLLEKAELEARDHCKIGDEDLIKAGVPVCICEDWRGWSTCGAKCPYHPPEYICLCPGCEACTRIGQTHGCQKRVAYMRRCYRCDTEH